MPPRRRRLTPRPATTALLLVTGLGLACAGPELEPGPASAFAEAPAPAIGARGALAGKTVYLSAGHGWVWYRDWGRWVSQRETTNGLVEDLANAEAVNGELVPYLRRMGARVVTVRESDMNPDRVVVDEGDAAREGAPRELATSEPGWGDVGVLTDGVNPFVAGTTALLAGSRVESGRVVYAPTFPRAGLYGVYVSYAAAPERAPDAHYVVRHAGGTSHYRIDQRRHGGTWHHLGTHWFEAGRSVDRGAVAVADDTSAADQGATISLDAVRFGGGMAGVDRGGGVLDRPAYELGARYHAQAAGAPAAVYDTRDADLFDDRQARAAFAAWDHEDGEDAVYLSWHSNAPNPARGTYTLISTDPAPGSRALADAVHGELVADVRAGWDPAWRDRGVAAQDVRELSGALNPEMPACLVEVAFHDTPADADALRDPRFRRLAARAMAQGIVRYFEARDGVTLGLPPEPPVAVRVQSGIGRAGPTLLVSWRPPAPDAAGGDAPTAYRVYTSLDGRAFDDGVLLEGLGAEFLGLTAPATRYVRVAAVNAAGESAPSSVVGARLDASGRADVLVVDGFDRLDRGMVLAEDLRPLRLGVTDRVLVDRMNSGAYLPVHGAAIPTELSFDGATDEAVANADVDLGAYRAVDWFFGEELRAAEALGPVERQVLAWYVQGGGRLLVSGSELGRALWLDGGAEDRALYRDLLQAECAADDAGTYAVRAPDGPFAGMEPFTFDARAGDGYDAQAADVLRAAGAPAIVALEYDGGAGGAAAIAWTAGPGGGGAVALGFPLEVVQGEQARRELVTLALAYLGVE